MGNNLLDIENATIFHHYKTILNDVNLTLREGEFIYDAYKLIGNLYMSSYDDCREGKSKQPKYQNEKLICG